MSAVSGGIGGGSPQVILIVDDEPQIRRVLRSTLAGDGTRVIEAATGTEAIDLAAAQRPALVVLDLGLPDVPGIDVCREIRRWSDAPIVVLSARHSEREKVALLDAGADDYITKPFGPEELRARVRAHLRRARSARRAPGEPAPDESAALQHVRAHGTEIDFERRSVTRDGERVHLTPTEWNVLRELAAQPGRTLTHRQLFTAVWGGFSSGDAPQHLRVHIASLRRKIEPDPVRPRLIHTEPGVGYRFEPLAAAAATADERGADGQSAE